MRQTSGTDLTGHSIAGKRRRAVKRSLGVPIFLVTLLALLLNPFASPAQAQTAGVGLTVTPLFPSLVVVGQQDVPAALRIRNISGGAGPVTLTQITLTPSCTTATAPCPVPDPGVLRLSPTGVGQAGTDCAGTVFTITEVGVTGTYNFTPSAPVVLQDPGGADTCIIDFTFDVLKQPTVDSDPAGGLQTTAVATAAGTAPLDAGGTGVGTGSGTSLVTVALPLPTISVVKTATPLSLPEPGGPFTFNVAVTNTSIQPVTITTLTDDIYGNLATQGTCNTAVGTVLAPGAPYSCSFTGAFPGVSGATQTDVVTATAVDADGNTAIDTATATVTITAPVVPPVPPTITVVKTASPLERPAPGGIFDFTVLVTNTSAEPVTIRALADDVYPNVTTLGTCTTAIGTVLTATPGPGNTFTCTFPGAFAGDAGDSQTDIVTVTAEDADANEATATDDATVSIIADAVNEPAFTVEKTVAPLTLPEPGGVFKFTVVITNTGSGTLTLISLVDDIYGDLSDPTLATCTNQGDAITCTFDGEFKGKAGDKQRDVVTAIVETEQGGQLTASDDATVELTGNPARPDTLPRTGLMATNVATFGGELIVAGGLMLIASRRMSSPSTPTGRFRRRR